MEEQVAYGRDFKSIFLLNPATNCRSRLRYCTASIWFVVKKDRPN